MSDSTGRLYLQQIEVCHLGVGDESKGMKPIFMEDSNFSFGDAFGRHILGRPCVEGASI